MVTAPVDGHAYNDLKSSRVVAQGFDELINGGLMSKFGGCCVIERKLMGSCYFILQLKSIALSRTLFEVKMIVRNGL